MRISNSAWFHGRADGGVDAGDGGGMCASLVGVNSSRDRILERNIAASVVYSVVVRSTAYQVGFSKHRA